jgi:uncharacterized membrane protein
MASPSRWPYAALVGLACSMRSTVGPAALAARGRFTGKQRAAVLLAAVGEFAADKHPDVPARTEPPVLGGRIVSGAYCGFVVAGPAGLVVAAASAAVGTYAAERARKVVGEKTGWPDPAVAVGEDLLAITTATLATRP